MTLMPTDPKWHSLPQALRKRKQVSVNLSDAAREKLARLAEVHPDRTKSAVIEDLILAVKEKD